MSGVSLMRFEAGADAGPVRLTAGDAASLVRQQPDLRASALAAGGGLLGCLVCGHPELYTQKAFPRALGIAVVLVAAVLAPFTWYLSLVGAAVVDCALYHLAPDLVACYACRSEHRGFAREPRHPRFDREIAERLRFGERAVMGKPMRPGGTAGAPEPEH